MLFQRTRKLLYPNYFHLIICLDCSLKRKNINIYNPKPTDLKHTAAKNGVLSEQKMEINPFLECSIAKVLHSLVKLFLSVFSLLFRAKYKSLSESFHSQCCTSGSG
uniref:Uncharacterized protein n=1 Tax=Micrurus corallinus TaxID=54390 RepID=A0A2D4FYG4_MICCO